MMYRSLQYRMGRLLLHVNKQWRLVFTWSGEHGEAQNIYLDNQDYR